MYTPSEKRFLAINLISIIALFILILAGGIVRGTGSGMGCPDWPKCFDQYIPPTEVSQLPADYKDKYVAKRRAKNERFANILALLGYTNMAYHVRNDQSILQPEEFNAAKTWTEYINRLVGAVYGVLLIACLVFSFTYLKLYPRIFILSFFNLFLVGFQGWLGSIVVSTNLLGWVVTVHMLVALLILAISIYTYFCARFLVGSNQQLSFNIQDNKVKLLAIAVLFITTVQVALGTEVREQIDVIASSTLSRSEWVSNVGFNFNLHRDLALLVVASNIFLFWMIKRRYIANELPFKYGIAILITIGLQAISGLVLSYLGLPPVTQVAHIVLACILFGAQFYLMLLLSRESKVRV